MESSEVTPSFETAKHVVIVKVVVNRHEVVFHVHKANGAEIKSTAITQMVPIQQDFNLFEVREHQPLKPIQDDEVVGLHDGLKFRATAPDDNSYGPMTPEIEEAVDDIKSSFAGHAVEATEDGEGGAYVVVRDIEIGTTYTPERSWFGFRITFQYPRADVYPHFLDGSIVRTDGKGHGTGITATSWRNISVLQLSRRSNHLDPGVDTAATKLAKVIEWFRTQ